MDIPTRGSFSLEGEDTTSGYQLWQAVHPQRLEAQQQAGGTSVLGRQDKTHHIIYQNLYVHTVHTKCMNIMLANSPYSQVHNYHDAVYPGNSRYGGVIGTVK